MTITTSEIMFSLGTTAAIYFLAEIFFFYSDRKAIHQINYTINNIITRTKSTNICKIQFEAYKALKSLKLYKFVQGLIIINPSANVIALNYNFVKHEAYAQRVAVTIRLRA